jgi:hypothetical protein
VDAQSTANPPLSLSVRIFASVVLLVLLGGMLLLVAPQLIVGSWPWTLAPYAARFLGAIYAAEFVALGILVVVNRWAPGRLMLAMALVFTLVVTLASAFHLAEFDFGRRGPWGWFVLYGGSAAVSAILLRQHRHLQHPGRVTTGPWRTAFRLEAALLGGYGALMLVAPETATAPWPWPADAFTARVYSGMFLAAGLGAFMLSRRGSPIDFLAYGLTQVTLGLASLAGVYLVVAPRPAYAWPDLTSWIIGCAAVAVMGLVALAAARAAPAVAPAAA